MRRAGSDVFRLSRHPDIRSSPYGRTTVGSPSTGAYNRPVSAFYCYILECADGSFYTGWTSDPHRRLREHGRGVGSKYTRSRRPVRLVYLEDFMEKREAMRRERAIKSYTRKRKEELIQHHDLTFQEESPHDRSEDSVD